jgi:copper(I)-binding protein
VEEAQMSAGLRLVPLVIAAAAASCGGTPRLEITAAQAQLSPMFGGAAAIFAEIRNRGDGRDTLVGARVDLPGVIAELHEVKDGRMVRAEEIAVPANGVVALRPGGLHVMVFRLPREVAAGTALPLRLSFRRSGELRAEARIERR